jgi:hypothetical protein
VSLGEPPERLVERPRRGGRAEVPDVGVFDL